MTHTSSLAQAMRRPRPVAWVPPGWRRAAAALQARHRLLLQPHGFEGLGFALEGVPPNSPLVAPAKHPPVGALKGRSARRAAPAKASPYQCHVPKVSHLVQLHVEVQQSREGLFPPGADAVVTVVRAEALDHSL